jgi:hypothetical protein
VATINISGIGFSSTSTVKLAKSGQSDIIATGISANSTQITCTLNLLGAVTGYWDVVISTGGAGSYLATFSNGFQYSAMTINSIKPRNGCNTVPLSVTNLSGAGFVAGSTIKISRAGQSSINASNINLVDSTKFTCTLDITGAATGYWDVIVATGAEVGALSVTLSSGLYVNIIGINSITPDRGYNNEPAFIANLSGAGFVSGTRVKLSKLGCSDIAATSENVLSASQITCTLRLLGATTGYWDVVVSTGGPGSAFATLEDEGYLIEIMAPKADLFAAKAYPVPFNAKFGSMTFDNLTPDATVKIFTIAGQLVRNVDDSAGHGKAFWDGKNDSGKPVASGIYIVLVKDANGTKKIKIAVEK